MDKVLNLIVEYTEEASTSQWMCLVPSGYSQNENYYGRSEILNLNSVYKPTLMP